MGAEIPWETRERAEELYIVDGHTFEQVASQTGVSVNQLWAWGKQGQWREKRQEYRQALGEIKRSTVLLRKKLLSKALQSLDPQDVYAVSRLEAATRGKGGDPQPASPVPGEGREIKTVADGVAALQEAIEQKLNIMLTRPNEMSLGNIRDIKKAFELLGTMKQQLTPEGDTDQVKTGGLSAEAADEIRRQILGIG